MFNNFPLKCFVMLMFCSIVMTISSNAKDVSVIVKYRSKDYLNRAVNSSTITSLSGITPLFSSNSFIDKTSQIKSNSPYFEELEKYGKAIVDENKLSLLLSTLKKEAGVELAYPLRKFSINEDFPPNDSLAFKQWNLQRIGIEKAWKISLGEGVAVGIIDTGIDFAHKDLKDNIWINAQEDINKNGTFDPWFVSETRNGISGDFDGIDNDGNGFTDDVIGYDFVDQDLFNIGDAAIRDPLPIDEQGHGTQCAGIVAARANNSIGTAGIAPKARLVSLRAFDASGNGEEDDIAAAIVYAALNGTKVLNMSFGDIVESPLVKDAVRFAYESGVVMCASSGNDNQQLTRLLRRFPASYGEVIAVGATTDKDLAGAFSSYGSYIGLSAPGVGIPTTRVGNKYNTSFQGTSAAAPHAAGVVALLLSANSKLSPEDIRGILVSTCDDLGTSGWDERYGAGLINASKALENAKKTLFTIEYPQQGQAFNRNKTPKIQVSGSTLLPLFQYSELFYTIGDANEKTVWTQIGQRRNERIMSSTLGDLEISQLQDTSYTLRLVAHLTNGNTVERRVRIDLVSQMSPFVFQSVRYSPMWFNQTRRVLCAVASTKRCRTEVHLLQKTDGKTIAVFEDKKRYTRNHSIILDYPFDPQQTYIVKVKGIIDGVDTQSVQSDLVIKDDRVFQKESLEKTGITMPISYLSPDVSNFYSDLPCIAVINSEKTKFGDLQLLEFSQDKFVIKETTSDTWIPQGFGDSNGDGIKELLCYRRDASLYASRSFQKTDNNTTFSNIRFSSEDLPTRRNRKEFSAAKFYDIDKDGKDEIFGFRDTVLSIVRFNGSTYNEITTLPNLSPRGPDGGENTHERPHCVINDIDNDGNIEVVFADSDADIMIYEYKNGSFQFESSFNHEGEGGTEFLQSGDIDGDGKIELVFGYYSSQAPDLSGEFEPSVWFYHIIRSDSPNNYYESQPEIFYGVRIGTEYERGFRLTNIDDQKGDELLISMFPHTYIMTWDNENKNLMPFWYSDSTFTRTFIASDLRKNNKTLIGLTNFNSVQFYTVSNNLPNGPVITEAKPQSENSPIIRWKEFSDDVTYKIDGYVFPFPEQPTSPPDFSLTTDKLFVDNLDLPTNTAYKFFVTVVKGNVSVTKPSETPAIFLHKQSRPLSAAAINENVVLITFDGFLPDKELGTTIFSLKDKANNNVSIIPRSVLLAGDSSVLLRFANTIPFRDAILSVSSFPDRYDFPTKEAELEFSPIQNRKFDSLYLSSIVVVNPTTLNLLFSKNFEETSAANVNNYTLEPFGIVESINVDNKSSVTITLNSKEPLIPIGKNYTLTVKNVLDVSGQAMTKGAGSIIGFTLAASNTDNAFVFPNPVRLSERKPIFFGNLPPRAIVSILTLDGKELAQLEEKDGNGGVEWNGKTTYSDDIATGVYLFKVTYIDDSGSTISSSLKKFTVLR